MSIYPSQFALQTGVRGVYHRFRRRLLARVHLSRALFVITFVLTIGLIVKLLISPSQQLYFHLTYHLPQASSTTTAVIWINSTPPAIFLVSYHHPSHKLSYRQLDPTAQVPSLKIPLADVYSRASLILTKSSVSEVTGQPIDFIVIPTPQDLPKFINLTVPQKPVLPLSTLILPSRRSELYRAIFTSQTDLPPISYWHLLVIGLLAHPQSGK